MKKQPSNPVLSEAHVKQLLYKCCVCDKAVEGFYGRWGSGGTCSRACERIEEAKPRYEPPKGEGHATVPEICD